MQVTGTGDLDWHPLMVRVFEVSTLSQLQLDRGSTWAGFTAPLNNTYRYCRGGGVCQDEGVGGGIVAVVPGRFAIATFSPPLNEAGNSICGMRAIRHIAGELGVGLYGANPSE